MDALGRIGDEYFRRHYAADPFAAGIFGVAGFEGEVPDPSRAAAAAQAGELARLGRELDEVDPGGLEGEDRISHAVLRRLLDDGRRVLADGVVDVAVTACGNGPFAQVVQTVPAALGTDAEYVSRLRKLPGFFDAQVERYLQAAGDGRVPTATGVRQAVAQVDAYLAGPAEKDPLRRRLSSDVVADAVHPALVRFRNALEERLLPVARDDEHVGLCHVPGGAEGYLGLVRAYTTTGLGAEEIHEIGSELVGRLREEFAERGGKALGTTDVDEVLGRLREDQGLRFGTAEAIVDTVTRALREAEAAVPDWFRTYDTAPCVIREMDPAEAEHSVLAYYMPPAPGRPGTHIINTYRPDLRARYEYEALAFHESVPGHHL